MPQDIPKEMAQKVPSFEQYSKNPKLGTQYVFMLLFIGYLAYNTFINRNDCSERVAVIERTLHTERDMHNNTYKMLMNRINSLESSLDAKSRALEKIGTKVGVDINDNSNKIVGGGK